jgi:hypothetical protein
MIPTCMALMNRYRMVLITPMDKACTSPISD